MKVLLINSVCGVGSTGKIVADLCEKLNENGHESLICYGRGEMTDHSDRVRIGSKFEFYVHAMLARVTGINGRYSPFATKKLLKIIKEYDPDVVHLHNLHGYYVNFYKVVRFLKQNHIPVVWTLHDELMFTGNCGYAYGCDRWQQDCGCCTQVKEYPKSLFFDFSKKQLGWKKKLFANTEKFCFVTPSEWLKKRVDRSILKQAQTVVIRNGIDTESVFRIWPTEQLKERLNITTDNMVLTVTDDVNSPRKGIDVLLEVAKMSKKQGDSIIYVVVGGVWEDCKADNVIFVDRTNNQKELAEYYSLADVFLMTSRCDNFPTVCLESLACGTPVVGFQAGGIAETAPESEIGSFVECYDAEQLYAAMKELLARDRNEVRDACRDYAVKHYTKDHMIAEYMKLYQKVGKEA